MSVPAKEWTQSVGETSYKISTDKSLIDRTFVNKTFASKDMHWTNAVSERSLDLLIANSCCFGLYVLESSGPKQVGFARLTTDYATLAYLTDVLVLEEHRGSGLGKWLIRCVNEVVDGIEDLRRYLLLTSKGAPTVAFYRDFGLSDTSLEDDGLVCMIKRGPGATKGHR